VKIWDAESGDELRTLSGHSGSVNAVAVFADGTRFVSGSDDKTVKIWDAESGTELCSLSGHSNAVTVSADGRKVVSGSNDGTRKIWRMIIKYVPTKRVSDLLIKALNEDVVEIIMKFAVATRQELEKKQHCKK
jgi:WD40 repeat protein